MPFKTFLDPETLPAEMGRPSLAIGNFDGVHRGHRAVIDAARALAKGGPTLALTFEPHPREVFRPDQPMFRLTPPGMKERCLAATGIDGMITLGFDRDFAATSAEDFLEKRLVGAFGAHAVAVGYDFHFGRNRAGTPEFLVQHGGALGLDIAIVAPQLEGADAISSSAIRTALVAGDVATANRLLGREWSVAGTVIHGEKRGRLLGYPTANMSLGPACGLAHGIYAVRVRLGERILAGVASYGRRPTFDNGPPLLETYIFDFSGDLYGREIEVFFVGFIRGEEKFDSMEALVARMDEDSRIARAMLDR